MSTLEKLLVLGVLVLVGVILAISLFWTREDVALTGLSDPLSATSLPPTAPPSMGPVEGAGIGAPSGSAAVTPPLSAAADAPTLVAAAPASAVVTPSAHVRPTPNPEFWFYTVQAGDTPQSISTRLTGTKEWSRAIDRANDAQPLVPGRPILIPSAIFASRAASPHPVDPAAETARRTPAAPSAATTTYVVKRGDNLRRIARMQLKDERRWKDIRDLNRLAGDAIREGQQLELPAR